MILVQIATALAIGAYVVLSKDAQHKRLDATPTQGKHHAGSAALTRLFSVGAALLIPGRISRLAMMYSSTYRNVDTPTHARSTAARSGAFTWTPTVSFRTMTIGAPDSKSKTSQQLTAIGPEGVLRL
jgi:hypothetical protein